MFILHIFFPHNALLWDTGYTRRADTLMTWQDEGRNGGRRVERARGRENERGWGQGRGGMAEHSAQKGEREESRESTHDL